MTIGAGILIAAVGAVLAFAVEVQTTGFDWNAAGVILMLTGTVIALVAAIATMASRRRVAYTPTYAAPATTPVVERPVMEQRVVRRPQVVREQRVERDIVP